MVPSLNWSGKEIVQNEKLLEQIYCDKKEKEADLGKWWILCERSMLFSALFEYLAGRGSVEAGWNALPPGSHR